MCCCLAWGNRDGLDDATDDDGETEASKTIYLQYVCGQSLDRHVTDALQHNRGGCLERFGMIGEAVDW